MLDGVQKMLGLGSSSAFSSAGSAGISEVFSQIGIKSLADLKGKRVAVGARERLRDGAPAPSDR